MRGANLRADAATHAGHAIDARFALAVLRVDFIGKDHGGAAALDAFAAGYALAVIDRAGGLGIARNEHAVAAGNEHGYASIGHAFFQAAAYLRQIKGVDGNDLLHAAGTAKGGDIHRRYPAKGEGSFNAWIILMAGHGGGAVIHDDDRALAFVVDHIQERGHAGMKKRAIANGANGVFA